jgi:predicted NAD/FAD-binding protein
MRIAIVGSGISGLVAARLLHARHEICVYEAADRIGGHTHTVDVHHAGERHALDTGFIVYNEATYPLFTRLLARLGVATQASSMSFGLSCERSGVEWASHGPRSLFAQPANLLLEAGDEKVSLGDYLRGARYSDAFIEHYALPMGAAIWSACPERFLEIPALTFVRFFDNHGLLAASPSLAWRTVRGGSARYLDELVAPYRDRIRTGCRVRCVRRSSDRVEILSDAGVDRFDHVVLATHSDQALALLEAPSQLERKVLGAIRYQRNDVALHTDETILPRSPRAWASWNYRVPRDAHSRAVVTYDMSRLQALSTRTRFLVTLNGSERIDPARVLRRFVYHHPIFDHAAIHAQKLHPQISGASRTHFCGAYWGYGFHEDGVRSAVAACAPFGAEL